MVGSETRPARRKRSSFSQVKAKTHSLKNANYMKRNELKNLVSQFQGLRIGVVGDLVADTYLTGTTDRVSREAPVLIVKVSREELVPGGAANVACNLAAMGAKVKLFGVVGEDSVGNHLSERLKEAKINLTGVVCDPEYGTVRKTRILAGAINTLAQQVLRVDHEPTAAPSEAVLAKIEKTMQEAGEVDGWIVSDYGYHLVGDTLIERMRRIAKDKPVLADSRYQIGRFAGLTAIKPNEQEALEAAEMKRNDRDGLLAVAENLKQRTQPAAVIMTLGNQGMLVYESHERYRFVPAIGSDQILDLTGAGDTAGATLILGLAAGADFYQAAMLANCAGSVVVMKYGCACCYPKELVSVIDEHIERD
jgi:rfaE bifunctional protein kinase chain/domain